MCLSHLLAEACAAACLISRPIVTENADVVVSVLLGTVFFICQVESSIKPQNHENKGQVTANIEAKSAPEMASQQWQCWTQGHSTLNA